MKKLSTLFFAIIIGSVAYAQIPNAGFEAWTTYTVTAGSYDGPNGWANLDSALAQFATYTTEKGTPGFAGASYLKLTSKSVPLVGVLPGIAVSGKASVSGTTFTVQSGFAISTRPQMLIGEWQYAPSGTDQGSILVVLTKWNTALSKRDTISLTNQLLSGSVTTWTAFSISLTYLHGSAPDSGYIQLASGAVSGTAGSYLYVDTLAFTGTVANGVVTVNNTSTTISLFPNPATGYTNVSYHSNTSGAVKISIDDINGKTIKEMDFKKARGGNDFPIDVSSFAGGIYFVKIMDDQGVAVRKLIVE